MNAEKIKAYREKHNLSQKKFAETVGLSPASIQLMEKGKRPVNEKVQAFFKGMRKRTKTAAPATTNVKAKSAKSLGDKFVSEIENSNLSKRTKTKILKQLTH